jgi:guanylate kinase
MLGVFILPPSDTALLERLRRRGREDEAAIQRRFAEAVREMARARENGVYDAFVINDDLPGAIEQVMELVGARLGRLQASS